jgi:CRISPR-associated protein Cas1
MVKRRVVRLSLDGNGSYLGMKKGCYILKDKKGEVKRYPLFEEEIDEVILKTGNSISTGALASFGFWNIDVLVLTARGRPVAILKSLDDDSHVKTRICQYEALNNEKGVYIAKQLVLSKIAGQRKVLEKYNLEIPKLDKFKDGTNLKYIRQNFIGVEGKYAERYFIKLFNLLHENLRPKKRKGYKAYDAVNNLFNLAYEILKWRVHIALIKAKLEPYLGYLHSMQYGKPSLCCDFQELYRYLIDDYIIEYCKNIWKKDLTIKIEYKKRNIKGKRVYLNDEKTKEFMKGVDLLFERVVEFPLIRHGKKQPIKTLINEETLLLAKYLREENKTWIPRIPNL